MGLSRKLRSVGHGLERNQQNLFFSLTEDMINRSGFDQQTKNDVRETAYELAIDYWVKVGEDSSQPDHKRKYAYQIRAELMRRLKSNSSKAK